MRIRFCPGRGCPTTKKADYALKVRLKGPGTEQGRVPLRDLIEVGRHVQQAVEGVGRLLLGQADSRRPGPKPKDIKDECILEVVALKRGSFELVLDVPQTEQGKLDGMHLGREAAETFVGGLAMLRNGGEALPLGYDIKVVHAVRDIGHVLNGRIDTIEFETGKTKAGKALRCIYDRAFMERMSSRIHEPVTNEKEVEGRLLMADFKLSSRRCRIHQPSGGTVDCTFGEEMMDTVQEFLRRNVRVTGEAQIDADTNRIKRLTISDIEPVTEGEEGFEEITAEDFWQEKSIDQLAEEQGVRPVERLEDILGRGADLWDDDEDFEAFLRNVERGRQDREPA